MPNEWRIILLATQKNKGDIQTNVIQNIFEIKHSDYQTKLSESIMEHGV